MKEQTVFKKYELAFSNDEFRSSGASHSQWECRQAIQKIDAILNQAQEKK